MKNYKICSCFGHRNVEITKELEEKLEKLYVDLIKSRGYNIFYFGGYGKFDELCHKIISKLKSKYQNIKLYLIRPYYENLSQKYTDLLKIGYDDCIYLPLSNNFGKLKIIYRNYAIVDKSDIIIFYIRRMENSGAYRTLCYAKKNNKKLIYV